MSFDRLILINTSTKLYPTDIVVNWHHVVTLVWNFLEIQGNISTLPCDLLQMVQGGCSHLFMPFISLSMLVLELVWLYFPANVFAEEHSPLFCSSWCPWCCIVICGRFENTTAIGFLPWHFWQFGCWKSHKWTLNQSVNLKVSMLTQKPILLWPNVSFMLYNSSLAAFEKRFVLLFLLLLCIIWCATVFRTLFANLMMC